MHLCNFGTEKLFNANLSTDCDILINDIPQTKVKVDMFLSHKFGKNYGYFVYNYLEIHH